MSACEPSPSAGRLTEIRIECANLAQIKAALTQVLGPDKAQEARAKRQVKRRAFAQHKHVYILAGIVRCADCALTLRCGQGRGRRYYRHLAKVRGLVCLVDDQGIRAEKLEGAWAEIISSISLPTDWKRKVEVMVSNQDERAAILREREQVQEKIRRLKRLYRDLVIDDAEYQTTLPELQTWLNALVVPSSPHLIQAGEYLESLGTLWAEATREELLEITRILVDEVRVDVPTHSIVAIKPKMVFRLLFTQICQGIGVEVI
jgi:hypothetical protein